LTTRGSARRSLVAADAGPELEMAMEVREEQQRKGEVVAVDADEQMDED
jgi:hypothetical protein